MYNRRQNQFRSITGYNPCFTGVPWYQSSLLQLYNRTRNFAFEISHESSIDVQDSGLEHSKSCYFSIDIYVGTGGLKNYFEYEEINSLLIFD